MKNNIIKLSWNEIETSIELLVQVIKKSKFIPDYIICVMRGGMVMSRILSDKLNVDKILPFLISSYTKNNKRRRLIIREFKYHFIKGKNVLICDEIVDSGNTLQAVIEIVKQSKPKKIKTVSLLTKDCSKIIPDYYMYKVPSNNWIQFPWENKP